MTLDFFYEYLLSKKGVTEHFPFDQDALVFKVGNKMIALTSLSEWEKGSPSVNLKCNPDKAIWLRSEYGGILPGFHMNKKHWNTVLINDDVPDILIKQLINHSYELVFNSLPAKVRGEILD